MRASTVSIIHHEIVRDMLTDSPFFREGLKNHAKERSTLASCRARSRLQVLQFSLFLPSKIIKMWRGTKGPRNNVDGRIIIRNSRPLKDKRTGQLRERGKRPVRNKLMYFGTTPDDKSAAQDESRRICVCLELYVQFRTESYLIEQKGMKQDTAANERG